MTVVVRHGKKTLPLTEKLLLGKGGQASVYRYPKSETLAIKVFHKQSDEMERRLFAMVKRPPRPLFERVSRFSKEIPTFAWPVDVVFSEATTDVAGYVMPKIVGKASLRMIANPSGRVRAITPRWLVHTAHSLALRVYHLSWDEYLMGDLNLENELVDRHAMVSVIDTDSLHFVSGDETFRCQVGVSDFQPPELIGVTYGEVDRTKDQTAWSLLILVHILLRNRHPFDCQWMGKASTPPPLTQRIKKGYWPESGKLKELLPHRGLVEQNKMPDQFNTLCRRMFLEGHKNQAARPSLLEIVTVLEGMKKRWR